MSIPVPSVFVRRWFARAFSNGETFDYSSLDTQHSDLVETMNLITQRLNLISTAAGTLITLDSTTSFTATASQTAFTVPTYNVTYDTVHVYLDGVRLAAASITKTSATVVTIPAQPVNTLVQIDVFTPGQGTTSLASTSLGLGASLVGINDASGVITATNVETALQEIATNLASSAYIAGVITLTGYLQKAGGTMTGAIAMGSNKITGLAAGTAASNDAARMADITSAAIQSAITAYLAATYLALSGGTMSGNIAMGGNKVTGLGAATAAGHAVRYDEFITQNASNITAGTLAAARMTAMVGDTGTGGVQGAVPAPAAGDGAALKFLRADGTWNIPTSNPGSFILLEDQKANTTAGGASVATTWTTATVNTEVNDPGGLCTLAANQFTLAAGTYRIFASKILHQVTEARIRLRNITDTVTTLVGLTDYSDNSDGDAHPVTLVGMFTITAPKVFEIQYWAGAVVADGLGRASSSGEIEKYCSVQLVKE